MDLYRIEFDVKGEKHSVIVNEDEDAKKLLRDKLGVPRLPRGTEKLSAKLVPLTELSKDELKRFITAEEKYYKRYKAICIEQPDLGPGWQMARDNSAKRLEEARALLK